MSGSLITLICFQHTHFLKEFQQNYMYSPYIYSDFLKDNLVSKTHICLCFNFQFFDLIFFFFIGLVHQVLQLVFTS